MKTLKIWNGRGHGNCMRGGHFYVAAYSRREAARLLVKASGNRFDALEIGRMDRELKNYYSEDCWGNTMDGIKPELGVWATKGYPEKPIKIV